MEEVDSTTQLLFENESKFYRDAEDYWSRVEPTIDGMLGGFGNISHIDIQGSECFLNALFNLKEKPCRGRALDCGAGIGRITKHLLSKYFDKIDLVEQNAKFVAAGKQFLSFEKNVNNFYNVGLQNFVPMRNYYDIIWCQWVLGHLTDDHLVNFLRLCSKGLRKNGMIVIKENITSEVIVDEEDSSVTRSEETFKKIFDLADLHLVRHMKQRHFPKKLFCVKMFALKPKEYNTETTQETEVNSIGNNENFCAVNSEKEPASIITKLGTVNIHENI